MKNELKQILGGNETFTIVYKGLFPLKLKPLDLLILSRVIEWYNNGKVCYETDQSLGEDFGASRGAVNDAIQRLEQRKLITKEVKNSCSDGQPTSAKEIPISIIEFAQSGRAADAIQLDPTRDGCRRYKSADGNIYKIIDKREFIGEPPQS